MAVRCDWWGALPTKRSASFAAWVGFGEVAIAAGFLFPTLIMVNAIANGWDPITQYLAVVVGGAVQGFLVAFVWWALLARVGVTAPLLAWLTYLSVSTALSWAIVQIPSLVPRDTSPASITVLEITTVVVALVLPMTAQWVILRRVTPRATAFAAISLVAWLLGAAIMAGTLTVLTLVTDLKSTIALLVFGAFVAVFTVAIGTWYAGVRLSAKR